jgi:hypothetical protein
MMNTFLSSLMATALVGSFAIASVVPANAAPVYVPKSDQVRSDVQNVNHTRRHWRMQQRRAELRAERRADRWARRHAWRDRYYYDNDGYSAYRPRYYRDDYPRYYRRHRPGVTLEFNLGR